MLVGQGQYLDDSKATSYCGTGENIISPSRKTISAVIFQECGRMCVSVYVYAAAAAAVCDSGIQPSEQDE